MAVSVEELVCVVPVIAWPVSEVVALPRLVQLKALYEGEGGDRCNKRRGVLALLKAADTHITIEAAC